MGRSICFVAFLALAMMLFVACEVQGERICKAESTTWTGICINKAPCRTTCIKEKFTDGHCSKLLRRCLCTKPCVFEYISNGAETIVAEEAKTLTEALLEEEIME